MTVERSSAGRLVVRLSGRWTIEEELPSLEPLEREWATGPGGGSVSFDTTGVSAWDSALVNFVLKARTACLARGLTFEEQGLPEGLLGLIRLATAVPERKGARKEEVREPFLARVGKAAQAQAASQKGALGFIGEAFLSVLALLRGRARFRRADFFTILQDCSLGALPIVSLISLLVGLILAFVGAVKLVMFGAQIYVASLVGIAMVRVMGAIMTGIIMAGRTGAAFAAQLGTMQVNEEIDALRTLGISPMEFLVLPRMLALIVMMPLLCLYADLMGILGGMIVGVGMLDLGVVEYFNMTKASVKLSYFWVGLFHAAVFGVLVALSGCLRGMQCGRSASAVGAATTSAVVTGILSIIVATALITVACNVIGI
jgi:phospholipid/cholesterol/gamma-HCH transport system permease protein